MLFCLFTGTMSQEAWIAARGRTPLAKRTMHPAFHTWDIQDESLESVENRIHDGVPRGNLRTRAGAYLDTFVRLFPWSLPKPGGTVLEIGSGLGYIMEAALQRLNPSRIVGLDVAANMIDKAKRRLARDRAEDPRIEFCHYDGVTIPYPDNSFDFVYSVATIQHIPKAYAYNLFFEINRILKPKAFAALHTPSYALLPAHEKLAPLKEECMRQIRNETGHWHFFYSQQELLNILSVGVGVGWLSIQEQDRTLWTTFSKDTEVAFCNETTLSQPG
jgi:ubiquinone/menaquinone biosynthesis C-methylase UbiE